MITGVYKIENINNGKFYIGSAAKSFKQRWDNHKKTLRNGTHRNIKLQRSFDKHGESSFSFSVLSFCPPEHCIKIEQWYIDKTNPYYNINMVAGSRKGATLSEESRQKIREKAIGRKTSDETKEKLRITSSGKRGKSGYKHTDEAKKKMSEVRKGLPSKLKGTKATEETKAKLREIRKGRQVPALARIRSSSKVGLVAKVWPYNNYFLVNPLTQAVRFDSSTTPGILASGETITF
jgi:hypothetical protein